MYRGLTLAALAVFLAMPQARAQQTTAGAAPVNDALFAHGQRTSNML